MVNAKLRPLNHDQCKLCEVLLCSVLYGVYIYVVILLLIWGVFFFFLFGCSVSQDAHSVDDK